MKRILFYLYPTISHYNACLGMAAYLREKNYHITFAGPPEAQLFVTGKGYEFEPFTYYPHPAITTLSAAWQQFRKHKLDPDFARKRETAYRQHIQNLTHLYQKVKPDYIFIDAHLSQDYLFLHGTGAKKYILHTKLSTKKHPGIPPLYINSVFQHNFRHRLQAEYRWQQYFRKRKWQQVLQTLAYAGKTDAYFAKEFARQQGLNLSAIFDDQNVFFRGVMDIPTVVLSPKQLDYPWKPTHPQEVHVAFPRFGQNNEKWQEFYKVLAPALQEKQTDGNFKIVYCSLGTISSIRTQDAINFLKNVIALFSRLPQTLLIVSAGDLLPKVAENNAANVRVFKNVPQLKLLDYCDLMITHGGLNSIKECITAGVPMLVYPLNCDWDQPGNAARVVYHQLGLMGDIEKDTPAEIEQKVKKIMNTRIFKENILQMQRYFLQPKPEFDLEKALGMSKV